MTIVKENLSVRWFVVQISRSVISPRRYYTENQFWLEISRRFQLKLEKERTGEKSLDEEDVSSPCLKMSRIDLTFHYVSIEYLRDTSKMLESITILLTIIIIIIVQNKLTMT